MNFVIFAVILLSFIYVARTEEANLNSYREAMIAIHKECATKMGIDDDIVKNAFRQGIFPEDDDFKCFLKCTHEKTGTMDKDGNVDFTAALAKFPKNPYKAKFTEAVDKCKDIKADDACQTAFDITVCLKKGMHSSK